MAQRTDALALMDDTYMTMSGNLTYARPGGGNSSVEIQNLQQRIQALEELLRRQGPGSCCLSVEEDPQQILGLDSITTIAPGEIRTVQTQASVAMQVTDFFVPASVASSFVVTSIKAVQYDAVLGGNVPAEHFVVNGEQRAPIKIGTVPPSSAITVTVQNIDTAARRFHGTFQGYNLTSGNCQT